ncbi:MAG TPA: hypothetical protein VLA16_06990 [Ideonella sp.]|nr:hypothetical protein [Ideonella sp.]
MMDLPPHSAPPVGTAAIEWLHVMPPADSADLVLGYEAAYPFLQPTAVPLARTTGADGPAAPPLR